MLYIFISVTISNCVYIQCIYYALQLATSMEGVSCVSAVSGLSSAVSPRPPYMTTIRAPIHTAWNNTCIAL